MWAAIVIIVVALLLVLAAPKPKIENARAANLGDFQFPRSKEGDPVAWFLGRVRMKSPNSLWFGDFTPVPIKKKQKTGLFSSKRVTVGYKYHVGLDLCWALGGHSPVTLHKLWSDKHVFWEGTANSPQTLYISKGDLFGGAEQRGGLAGRIDFYPGSFDEERNAYLAEKADPEVPAYIGQARTVFRGNYVPGMGKDPENLGYTLATGFYFGTTTNVSAISAEMSRYSANVHPTYSIMPNGMDVNPMELLYAGFTEKFGMPGVSVDDIDLPSWQACAEVLYNEGIGMSLLIQQSITGKDLCEEVMRMADGILYQDTNTGKMVAVLIRDNYDVDTLPVLDNSIIKELVSFSKTTWDQTYNQCRVTFKDRENDYADRVATAQDFANINFQNRVKNTDISMPGCFVNGVANHLAVRQLSLLSVPLFQIEIRCNRRANSLKPGDLFVFEWAPYGISNMVMRVQKINKGTLANGTITINAVQDRFATALAVFAPPVGSGWTPINTEALPVATRRFFEVPKWFHQFFVAPPAANQAAFYVAASPPGSASVGMDVDMAATSNFADPIEAADDYGYNGSFLLATEFAEEDGKADGYSPAGFTAELVDMPEELVDQKGVFDPAGEWLVLLGDEFMQVADLIDNGDGTYAFRNVYRALLDTDFALHGIGSRGYLIKQSDGLLATYMSNLATGYFRIRDITPTSTLPPADALSDSLTASQRAQRPAPPDFLQINGTRTPASAPNNASISISWRHRNRNQESLIRYNASSDTPEAGVSYHYRTRLNGGAWSSMQNAGSGTSAAVPAPGLGITGTYEIELWSKRDEIWSLTGDSCAVPLIAPDPGTEVLPVAISQSTTFDGAVATLANMRDADTAADATGGGTQQSSEEWIQVDLGAAHPIKRVELGAGNIPEYNGNIAIYLNGADIQYSGNATNWTTVASVSGMSDSDPKDKSFYFTPISARYWRIRRTGWLATSTFRLFE